MSAAPLPRLSPVAADRPWPACGLAQCLEESPVTLAAPIRRDGNIFVRASEVMDLRAENERLRDRLEELEGLLGVSRPLPPSLPSRIGGRNWSRPSCWRLLNFLIARRYVTRDGVVIALHDRGGDRIPDAKIVDIWICHLRRFLKLHGIEIRTHWGEGWSLSREMKEKAKALVKRLEEGDAA
jgi:hypothetical protein